MNSHSLQQRERTIVAAAEGHQLKDDDDNNELCHGVTPPPSAPSSALWFNPRCRDAGSWRVPIGAFVVALVAVAAVIVAFAVFLMVFFNLSQNTDKLISDYADGSMERVSFAVARRFDRFYKLALLAQQVVEALDPLEPNLNLHPPLTWFGRRLLISDLHMVLLRGANAGYVLGPYSPFDPAMFPRRAGCLVVSNVTNSASTTAVMSGPSYMDVGYYRMDTFEPLNTTHPMQRLYNATSFNFTARPYASTFMERLSWSAPYVSILAQTSSIAIGGPYRSLGAAAADRTTAGSPSHSTQHRQQQQEARRMHDEAADTTRTNSTFSFHDYSSDVTRYFRTNPISNGGVALLIDRASRAFVGGSIADASIDNSSGAPSMVLLEDLRDQRVAAIVAASAAPNGAVSRNALLTCATPCSLIYRVASGDVVPASDFDISLLADFSVVRVTTLADKLGLDMRLVLVLPSSDFCEQLQQGVRDGGLISGGVLLGLLLVVGVVVHVVVSPLRNAEQCLLGFSAQIDEHRVRRNDESATGRNTSTLPCTLDFLGKADAGVGASASSRSLRCLVVSETVALQSALQRLRGDMMVFASFLPTTTNNLHDDDPSGTAHCRAATTDACEADRGAGFDVLVGSDALDQSASHRRHTTRTTDERPCIARSRKGSPMATSSGPQREDDGSSNVIHCPSPTAAASAYGRGTLWRVPVTTVASNLVGYDTAPREHPGGAAGGGGVLLQTDRSRLHALYLGIVQRAAHTFGGTVDLMFGDRIWVHFNAAHRVVGHATAAARMMLEVERELALQLVDGPTASCVDGEGKKGRAALSTGCSSSGCATSISVLKQWYHGVRMGASTAHALCGVMGPPSLRAFTVVGEGVQQAASLCLHRDVPDDAAVSLPIAAAASGASYPPRPLLLLVSWRTLQLLRHGTAAAVAAPSTTSDDNDSHDGSIVALHVCLAVLPYEHQARPVTALIRQSDLQALHEASSHQHLLGTSSFESCVMQRVARINNVYEAFARDDHVTGNRLYDAMLQEQQQEQPGPEPFLQ